MNSPTRRGTKVVTALVATAALTFAAAGCGGDSGGTKAGIDFVNKGKLTVCTHLPYKPFEFRGKGGKIVGFDSSMVGLLAKDLGLELSTVDIGWNQIISGAAFTAKKCDLGMGAMTITPERAKAILISDPYFDATQALLVRTDDPHQDLSDLKGKKLGVQTDTTGQIYADKHAKEFGYSTVVFDDSLTEFNALKAGSIDAAINDNGPLYEYSSNNSDTKVTAEFDTGEKYGFAAKKGDKNAKKLIGKLNTVLAKSKKNGEYDKIYKKWFGTVPGNVDKKSDG